MHLSTLKRRFRYLKGTTNLGLCCKSREKFSLQDYYDVHYSRQKNGTKEHEWRLSLRRR